MSALNFPHFFADWWSLQPLRDGPDSRVAQSAGQADQLYNAAAVRRSRQNLLASRVEIKIGKPHVCCGLCYEVEIKPRWFRRIRKYFSLQSLEGALSPYIFKDIPKEMPYLCSLAPNSKTTNQQLTIPAVYRDRA